MHCPIVKILFSQPDTQQDYVLKVYVAAILVHYSTVYSISLNLAGCLHSS